MTALKGFRILELAEGVSGEYCGKLLADFGAQVIKIERPGSGSPVRSMSPFGSLGQEPENSALFAYLNTNKKSAALDISNTIGLHTLDKLLSLADAVIDDHEPGWLSGVGLNPLEFQALHPRLVLCSITPYGQHPPDGYNRAEDLTIFHAGGWGFHTPSGNDGTRPPLKGAGRFLASYEAALDAALCIVSSLYAREETGEGRFIDISKQRVLYSRLDYVLAPMIVGETDARLDHLGLDLGGPASILPCQDGFVYIWLSGEDMWQQLREMLGHAPWLDEDFPTDWLQQACTPDRIARTRKHLTEWLATRGKHEVAEVAQKRGVMIVPLNNPDDLVASPQFQFRRFFAEVDHPILGKTSYPTVPYKMSTTPARIVAPAPLLGQDTETILEEWEQIG
jgi:crotonobetainyl-CoA:carnitine CoA-transferase CaiB-like acyl-CoA transferase